MHSINLNWKSFNLSLAAVEAWLRTNAGPYYVGNSADADLTLWFTDVVDGYVQSTIQAYWDSLDETCPEALNYVSRDTISAQIAALRADLVTKTWDEMSTVERKLVVGATITAEDLGHSIAYHVIPDGYEGYGNLGHDGYGDYT